MKFLQTFFILIFLITQTLFSQSHKLLETSQGKLTYSKVLFNLNHTLLGYVFVYENKSDNVRNPDYEYVLLDTNLQIVTKQSHGNIRINFYTSEIQNIMSFGDSLLVYKRYCCASYCFTSFYYVSTKKNFKSNEFVRSIDGIEPLILNKKSYKDYYKTYWVQDYYVLSNSKNRFLFDVLLYGHDPDGFFELVTISAENKLLRDTIAYTTNNRKKDLDVDILLLSDNKLIILVSEFNKQAIIIRNTQPKLVSKFIQCVDIVSKKTLYSYPVKIDDDKYLITVEAIKDGSNTIYTGKYGEYIKNDPENKSAGIYYIHLDSSGNELRKSYIGWNQLDPTLRLNKDGKNKDGYKLRFLNTKLLDNGSIIHLADLFKPASDGILIPGISVISSMVTSRSERSKNFVLIQTNEKLELQTSKLVHTELTKGNDYDYIYSDYTKDRKGVISYYKDENNEKEKGDFILGIIKFVNSKLELDKVKINNSKSKKLLAIPAKREYVIIAELDKDDNLVELRLEKVNL